MPYDITRPQRVNKDAEISWNLFSYSINWESNSTYFHDNIPLGKKTDSLSQTNPDSEDPWISIDWRFIQQFYVWPKWPPIWNNFFMVIVCMRSFSFLLNYIQTAALRFVSHSFFDSKSTNDLDWLNQSYLNQWRPRSVKPYDATGL